MKTPLTKVFDDGFDAGAMADTISMFFQATKVRLDDGSGELSRFKLFPVSWTLRHPLGKLSKDANIGINGCFISFAQARLLILANPRLSP